LAFGKHALKVTERQVMNLPLNYEPLHAGLIGQSFGDGPALENAVFFEAEIEVVWAGVVLLDQKAELLFSAGTCTAELGTRA
jgi:hypothetical protein